MNPLESFSADTTGAATFTPLAPRVNGIGRPCCPMCLLPSFTIEEAQFTILEGWPVMQYGGELRCPKHGRFDVATASKTWRDREPML